MIIVSPCRKRKPLEETFEKIVLEHQLGRDACLECPLLDACLQLHGV